MMEYLFDYLILRVLFLQVMLRQPFLEKYNVFREQQARNVRILSEAQYQVVLGDLLDIRRHGKPFIQRHHSTFRKYDITSAGKEHKVIR